jgi:hypothetical protein
MLCLIILTFKHEKSVWLVLKCIHDLQKKKHTKQTNKQKTERKKFKFIKMTKATIVNFFYRSYQVLLTDVVIIPRWAIQAPGSL